MDGFEICVLGDSESYADAEDPLAYFLIEVVARKSRHATKAKAKPPVEIVLVLDVSGSMNDSLKYPLVREAVATMAGHLAPEDRLSLLLFSHESMMLLPLTASSALDASGAVTAMDGSPVMFGRHTMMAPALARALDHLSLDARKNAVTRVYCLTDGELHDAPACANVIAELQRTGSEVHLYGFGRGFDVEQLARLVGGAPGSCVKPLLRTEEVVDRFRHLAATAADVVARDLTIDVTMASTIVCGDAFQYRPREVHLGAIGRDRIATLRVGSVEQGRAYTMLVETRLPSAPGAVSTAVGAVTLRWETVNGESRLARAKIDAARGRGGSPVARVGLVREALLGLRDADPAAQIAMYQAKLALYQAERRDPALLEALARKLDALANPDREHCVTDDDERYLESSPCTTV